MVGFNFTVFIDKVEHCIKRQTIRKTARVKPGQHMQLFEKQRTPECRKLHARDPICTKVRDFEIDEDRRVYVDGVWQRSDNVWDLAQADGFSCAQSFMDFFEETYGLPFKGKIINWDWDLKNGR